MYYVCKRLEISAAHSLMLSYESKCEDLHGHNWIVKIYCKSETLNQDGEGPGPQEPERRPPHEPDGREHRPLDL